jgi:hypothetical protein
MFHQFEFHQMQTLQPINNTSNSCCPNVCLTILHVIKFSIPRGSCILEGYANSI